MLIYAEGETLMILMSSSLCQALPTWKENAEIESECRLGQPLACDTLVCMKSDMRQAVSDDTIRSICVREKLTKFHFPLVEDSVSKRRSNCKVISHPPFSDAFVPALYQILLPPFEQLFVSTC